MDFDTHLHQHFRPTIQDIPSTGDMQRDLKQYILVIRCEESPPGPCGDKDCDLFLFLVYLTKLSVGNIT
jgi:hypothetical protein